MRLIAIGAGAVAQGLKGVFYAATEMSVVILVQPVLEKRQIIDIHTGSELEIVVSIMKLRIEPKETT